MTSTRLALITGIAALSMLGLGCSTPTEIPPEDTVGEGEPDPGAATGTNEQDSTSKTAGTPAEENSGTGATKEPGAQMPTTPAPPQVEPPKPKSKMTFFVTSTGSGAQGGNLGGLDGADKKCQDLAAAVTGGDHVWHAYLSTEGKPAKDRIGAGPWLNQAGKQIAADVASLHAFNFVPSTADMLDETGKPVPIAARMILTGTKQDGTPLLTTCQNWTSNSGGQQGRAGDASSDTSPVLGVRWNDVTKNYACSQQAITANKGEGRLYCFAID